MAFSIRVKVYYEDTDAGGVVYYANYLRFMERARTEFLAANGIDVAESLRQGLSWVVAHADISYRRPAHLGDTLDVTAEVQDVEMVRMNVKQNVLKDGVVLVEGMITVACVNPQGRPMRLPESVTRLVGT